MENLIPWLSLAVSVVVALLGGATYFRSARKDSMTAAERRIEKLELEVGALEVKLAARDDLLGQARNRELELMAQVLDLRAELDGRRRPAARG